MDGAWIDGYDINEKGGRGKGDATASHLTER